MRHYIHNKNFIFFLLIHFCLALYEDNVGKFDWRKQFVGCPHQTWFGRIDNNDALFIVSKENVIARIDINNGNIVWRQLNEQKATAHNQLQLRNIDHSALILELGNKYRTFDIHTGGFQWQKTARLMENTSAYHIVENELLNSTYHSLRGIMQFIRDNEQTINVKIFSDGTILNELKVIPSDSDKHLYKIFAYHKDCRLELFEFSDIENKLKLLWRRYESLASISDVLMVDLPLSEAQAQIESEFKQNEPILRSFLLRIHSQIEQLHRFFTKTTERFVQTMNLILSGEFRYSIIIRNFLVLQPKRRKNEVVSLERDYFNMHKIFVVSTFAGTLHGLNSMNGDVLWTLRLEEGFLPYKAKKLPLFLLRGTSFYQWGSQAAIVHNIKNSLKSIIIIFNPITGERIDQLEISNGLLRIELWPSASTEQLYPLLIIRNDKPNTGELWPIVQMESQQMKPVYLMTIQQETGLLKGYEVLINKGGQLSKQWQSSLFGFGINKFNIEDSIIIHGKNLNEKVHSQGRVLIDRSVLYKYLNPNLVAILLFKHADSKLWLYLVDAVSGEIIYIGKFSRVLPPFNLVQCENWIMVAYWSEKARRTEITIIELFEGFRQNNATTFNSLLPRKENLKIFTQSYIFPQGISAMSATDTEQGLTYRSVIFALPFGGILEMSRRLLDARRPSEITPELREEMLIPYIPELPLATEDLINYNQTVKNVRGIKTAPSGLESTSLIFVYGLDLFYTHIQPSGTFDILKDDFDYVFISAVMLSLTVLSYVCKRISRYQNIQKAWE